MEESEQRRERLKAMRMEASEAEGIPSFSSPAGTGALSNPFVETPTVQESHAMPRFDYYTDPIAAYSGNRRQNNFPPKSRDNSMPFGGGNRGSPIMQLPPPPLVPGPGNPQMTFQPNYGDPRMQHGGRPHYYGPGPIRSPMGGFNPHPEHQHHGFSNQSGYPPVPYFPGNSPGGIKMPRPGFQWARAGSSSSGPTTNPGYVRSPFPNTGRGRSRGHWTNNNPSPGGRGIGYRGDFNQTNLYRKFMVEDQWKDLKPVLWRARTPTKSAESFQKWSSVSSGAKKARVEKAFNASESKESIADYLATAFDETIEGGVRGDVK